MSEKLLPCPFCGGEAELFNGGPGRAFIMCDGCRCTSDDGTTERIVAAWNRRAPLTNIPHEGAIK